MALIGLRAGLLVDVRFLNSNACSRDLETSGFGDLFFGGLVMTEIGLITWKIVQYVLWAGPFGVLGFLALIAGISGYIGYVIGRNL